MLKFWSFELGLGLVFLIGAFEGASAAEPWEIGPFVKDDQVNPILLPRNDTDFFCPVRKETLKWEIKDVFNPTALVRDGLIHMLYRAEDNVGTALGTSRVGLAISSDGLTFERELQPIFYPDNDTALIYEWEGGCEDPRIVKSVLGIYYMTYTAYDGTTARLLVASSANLRTWVKHGPVFKNFDGGSMIDLWSKSGSIVCTLEQDGGFVAAKINNRYWMYFGDTNIFLAWSLDLVNWNPVLNEDKTLKPIFGPRPGYFDSDLVEPGPQAIIRPEGILLIYNCRNKAAAEGGDPNLPDWTYTAAQILLDPNDPSVVLQRAETYFMKPDKPYELEGQVNAVVFVEGLVRYNNKWFIYYGTADSKIAVAVAN
jgi:predicted GH43/DUF377 family glycosyl hydrolase